MATSLDHTLSFDDEAVPYVYIGDSHAGALGTLIFRDDLRKRAIVTKTLSIWRFVASDVLSKDGMIGDGLMQTLRRSGAFRSSKTLPPQPGLRPVQTRYGPDVFNENLAVAETAHERPFVLMVGEIDARYILRQLALDELDIEVPFDPTGLDRLPTYMSRQTISKEQITRLLFETYAPLFRGLHILKEAGLRTLFLHSLPPPAIDDEESARLLMHPSPAVLRYKLTMFVNHIYAEVCKELGVGFINTWPLVTNGNLLKREYYLDGLHLNRKHSILSVTELHRQFTTE